MSDNNLDNPFQDKYPKTWVKSACVTCRYFVSTDESGEWEWDCEHPNKAGYLDLPVHPPVKCSQKEPTWREIKKSIYAMQRLLQQDFNIENKIEDVTANIVSVNGKNTDIRTALALLTNLYKNHATYKQALDRLNYCRHVLKLESIKG